MGTIPKDRRKRDPIYWCPYCKKPLRIEMRAKTPVFEQWQRSGFPLAKPPAPSKEKHLPRPHGRTEERLTIKKLDGLDVLKEKYAAEIERGRQLQKRLD